jgi:hypothetical protein
VQVHFDRNTEVTTGRLTANLPGTISRLALVKRFDPRAWCASPFFAESYKTIRTSEGYERDHDEVALGEPWKGHLFEHFRLAPGGVRLCRFINILNIDYRVTGNAIRLEYSLHRPLQGSVWFSPFAVGVDVDKGYVTAVERSGTIALEIVKHVRFVELTATAKARSKESPFSGLMNRFAPVALKTWLKAAVKPLGKDIAAMATRDLAFQ